MKNILGVLLILTLGAVPAWAALGQYESSVSVDQQYLRSEDRVQAFQGYRVHQLTTANGTIVREYVSPQGLVFGVTWRGHFMPNLQQLLGTYMTELQQGQRTQVVRRRAVTIQTDDFVFSSVGHLRSFRGRAYVPSLVPSNVAVEVIQ
jgi:hypothetical protein